MDVAAIKQHPIHALLVRAANEIPLAFSIESGGETLHLGAGEERFRIRVTPGYEGPSSISEYALGRAYVEGAFDIEGDMFALLELRQYLAGRANWLIRFGFLRDLFVRGSRVVNRKSIAKHYTFGDDFYLHFIDEAYRFYSHCLFRDEDETLEAAAEHKLKTMFEALGLKPGMRLLDIGAGWGGVHEYCGPRGIDVTSVTLTEDSRNYTTALIDRLGLDKCRVLLQDFLEYEPEEPYDAVVIYGVIEHIPYYRKFTQKAWQCLRPGGRIYLDASATIEKYDMNDFTRHYIWPGTHTFLCLQDMIGEFLFNGFEVVEAVRETRDYELTMWHWATRFDAKREEIVAKYGEELFRAFRLYLWAGCHAFHVNSLQAYHVVAERCESAGPRPGILRRGYHFLRGLV